MRLPASAVAVLLVLGVATLAASPAQARPKVPALTAVTSAAATAGAMRVQTTWRPAGGTMELQLRAGSGKARRSTARRVAATKGKATLRPKGGGAQSTWRVRARRCLPTGGGRRTCSAWSRWRKPVATTPTGPGTTPTPPAGAGPTIGRCPMLPASHAFNQDVSALPVHPNSAAYMASIGTGRTLHPDFGSADLGGGPGGFGIPYRVVPATEPLVPVTFTAYGDESDPGPYPTPLGSPIEGGPQGEGDRHTLVVREGECKLYELYRAFPREGRWDAESGAVWNLRTGAPRPAGWTSADAAGLPILPGLARYDEVAAGEIRHALRFTVRRTQRAYIAPASHWASSSDDRALPPMGLRVRMRADYPTDGLTGQSKVIVAALKRYGMIVADNGSDWYVSGAPDPRWDDEDLNQIKRIPGTAFEAVDTGPIVTP